eukprot:TRINITY_DN32131_c0_g1_i1.p1 TRINITY_DN32131_c0_g1~~TRINITY_DN32131_c0_g1_i1.p1  ORF type:complete len:1340 (-),score=248.01 TRINITY_DN32131_c0_g1_i1:269-4288(-)
MADAGCTSCFGGVFGAPRASVSDIEAGKTSVDHVLSFTLNGQKVEIPRPDPRVTLLEYLRDTALLTGTKRSCLQGGCGACLVAIQRYDQAAQKWVAKSVNSCLKPLASCDGAMITTVEGVGTERKGCHAIQERIAGNHGMQCGFCTPGMVMNMYALMKENGKPTAQQCMDSFDGNICRCTGYRNLVNVAESFAKDASPACQDLASKFTAFDADSEKLQQMPAPTQQISKVFKGGDITWYAPTTLQEVIDLRQKVQRAALILGDTAKGMRQAAYETFGGKQSNVIYLGFVDELNFVEESHGELHVGAGCRIQDLCDAVRMRKDKLVYADELGDAFCKIAQRHVRSEAGWAGNLMLTRVGFPSDLVPALLAADAVVHYVTTSPQESQVKMADFKQGHVPANALLTKVSIPLKNTGMYRYYRVGGRKWLAIAFVNAAFWIDVDPSTKKVKDARLAFGVYAQGPKRSESAEQCLIGSSLDTETLQKTIAAMHKDLDDEFQAGSQFVTVDNPKGKDEYRKTLPDSFLFKFFQEAQLFYGIKACDPDRLGTMRPVPLKRGVLKFQELAGREDKAQLSAKGLTTGQVRYADDTQVPSYYGYLVLSTCATGKVKKIDTSKAEACEGVKAVITAKDIPGANSAGFVPGEEPLFCPEGGDIFTAGQQLALVVATSYRAAKRAAAEVKVDVENANVGAVVTIDEAIAADSKLAGAALVSVGDKEAVEAALKSSENVIEGSTYIIGQHAFPMEKQSMCAIPEERNGMTLVASTQAPDFTRAVVAGILGLHGKGSLLTVKCERAGGAFGPKNSRCVPVAGAAAVAAHVLDFPVKVAMDAGQEHTAIGGRHSFKVSYKVGYKRDGSIQACKVEAWGNGGCTHDFSGFLFLEYAEAVPSVYGWGGKFCIDVHGMKLNLPSNTAVRSFGNPQGMFTTEAIIEHVASALGKPAEEIREKNMLTKSTAITPWKQTMEFFNADMLYEKVKADAKYNARVAEVEAFNAANRWRKRGVSVVPLCYGHSYVYAAGTGALVNIHGSDGSVTVHHGGCEIGQGIHIKVAQVVALTLGCDLDAVKVPATNTDVVPNMRFTGGSITSEVCCEAARRACLELNATLEPHRKFLREKKKKEIAEDPSKSGQSPEPTWAEVVAAANSVLAHQEKLSATGIFAPTNNKYTTDVQGNPNGKPFHGDYFTFGAACSEVELDVLTGETQVLRSDVLFDVGQSLNPGVDIAQIEGAFVWGIGYYMYEEPLFDKRGIDRTQGVWEYKPPMAAEVPRELSVELLRDNPFQKGILGSKAVGEPPFMLAYSVVGALKKAIASARKDAGAPATFSLPMPCTVDAVQRACATKTSQMTC